MPRSFRSRSASLMVAVRSLTKTWRKGAILGLAVATTLGCDLGTYSRRYTERLPQLTRRAELGRDLHNSYLSLQISAVNSALPAVPGGGSASTGVKVRLPKIFDAESRLLSASDPADISGPPGMALPIGLAYERYITNAESDRLPIYFYLVAIPKAEIEMSKVEELITGALPAEIDPVPSWQSQVIETLDDGTLDFRALKISQAQPFQVQLVDNAPEPQTLEGQLQFYARTEGDYHLVFIFRYPSQLADSLGFPTAIEGCLGTLKPN